MSYLKKHIALGVLAGATYTAAYAQDALRSAYFLEGYTYRHELNASFAPEYNFVSMPVLGGLNETLSSNVGLNTFLYPMNGQLTTFMSPTVDANTFLSKIKKINKINEELTVPIIAVGFKGFKGYNTITISSRTTANLSLPGDLFRFMKLGMTSDNTHYSFKDLTVDASEIVEVALGHSRQLLPELRIGAKAKVLVGIGNVHASIDRMDVTLSNDKWTVDAEGSMAVSAGEGLIVPTKAESGKEYSTASEATQIDLDGLDYDKFGLSGMGFAVDLGATYQLTPELQLSAAINDLGFMSWNHTVTGRTLDSTWTFDGFKDVAVDKIRPTMKPTNKLSEQLSGIGDDLADCVNFHRVGTDGSRTAGIGATLLVGGSYEVCRMVTGGLLFTHRFNGPYSWTEGFKVTPQYVPVGTASASVNLGINFTFGSKTKTALASKLESFHTRKASEIPAVLPAAEVEEDASAVDDLNQDIEEDVEGDDAVA